MLRSSAILRTAFSIFCLLYLVNSTFALPEKEPNNNEQQANPLSYGDTATGTLQDRYDYFKVTLPAAGKVAVTVSGCPPGGQLQVGTTGLGYTGWQDSNGGSEVTLTFEAKSRTGVIWVSPKFVESVCGYDWCAGRFVTDGPYHVTRASPKIPNSHEGTPILAAAKYTLTLKQGLAGSQTKNPPAPGSAGQGDNGGGTLADAGEALKVFRENNFGFSFKLPAVFRWELLPDNDGYLISAPPESELAELIMVVQAVSKAQNPGSSAARQLQEAKDQILGLAGSEIRSEDQIDAAGQSSPFLLATYPARNSRQDPTTFGHLQMILDNDPNYYWISYSAPLDHFRQHQNIFADMIATFHFFDPLAHTGPAASSIGLADSGRIEIDQFSAGGGNFFNPRVVLIARGFGSGAQLLKLFAVEPDGKLTELQTQTCREGAVVNFNASYSRMDTKWFELRLYDQQDLVIARIRRES